MSAEMQKEMLAELQQCEVELHEAANLLRGAKLFGTASLYDLAVARVANAIIRFEATAIVPSERETR